MKVRPFCNLNEITSEGGAIRNAAARRTRIIASALAVVAGATGWVIEIAAGPLCGCGIRPLAGVVPSLTVWVTGDLYACNAVRTRLPTRTTGTSSAGVTSSKARADARHLREVRGKRAPTDADDSLLESEC